MTAARPRTGHPTPDRSSRPTHPARVLATSLALAAIVSATATAPAPAHTTTPATRHATKARICHRPHQRHCIKAPHGVGRPHANQDSSRGPKLIATETPDGLGADRTGTQGAVDWAYQNLGNRGYDNYCGRFVAHAFGRAALGYATAWQAAVAFGLRPGGPPPGSLIFFRPDSTNGYAGHVGIALPGNRMISAQSNGVRIATLGTPYWRTLYAGWSPPPASWPGRAPNGTSPPLFPAPTPPAPPAPPAPVTPTAPAPTPAPPGPPPSTPQPAAVDRRAVSSYDRLVPGAPHNGYFVTSWQPFTAASNTLTTVGITVGNPNRAVGQPAPESLLVRLCSAQPDAAGSCPGQLAEANPQIVNYGATVADIGDVPVNRGQTYWVIWYQPPSVGGATWVTYWWAGGGTIATSDQMQMFARGYDR